MKKQLIGIICILVLLFTVGVIAVFGAEIKIIPNDETGIPDKYLYQTILDELRKEPTDQITKEDALKVKEIFYSSSIYEIKSLKGIENLANLERLAINSEYLTNLDGIENLDKLREIAIYSKNVTDYSAIKKVKNLEELHIDEIGLTSDKFKEIIEGLTTLRSVWVNYNKLTDLRGIETLVNLEELSATGNKLTNIDGVEKLPKLYSLRVAGNKLYKLPDLTNLGLDPEYCAFSGNKIKEKELKTKLPISLTYDDEFMSNQILFQNVKNILKITTPKGYKKIKSTTKKIKGVTQRKATVVLINNKGKIIKRTRANGSGKFQFKNLNLKKYAGKKITIRSYLPIYNSKDDFTSRTIKKIKFRVKKAK